MASGFQVESSHARGRLRVECCVSVGFQDARVGNSGSQVKYGCLVFQRQNKGNFIHTALGSTGVMSGLNANPELFDVATERRSADDTAREVDPSVRDPLDELEVFEMIRGIKDPEHPHTLEQLRVVQRSLIRVDDARGRVFVNFTPTIPHCSMATLIGLSIRVQLLRLLPSRFKVDVNVTPGTHMNEKDVNKQLSDKERVAAALENENLLKMVNSCLQGIS